MDKVSDDFVDRVPTVEELMKEAGSHLCGHRGFAGPSCCILTINHLGGHSYGIPSGMGGERYLAERLRTALLTIEHLRRKAKE